MAEGENGTIPPPVAARFAGHHPTQEKTIGDPKEVFFFFFSLSVGTHVHVYMYVLMFIPYIHVCVYRCGWGPRSTSLKGWILTQYSWTKTRRWKSPWKHGKHDWMRAASTTSSTTHKSRLSGRAEGEERALLLVLLWAHPGKVADGVGTYSCPLVALQLLLWPGSVLLYREFRACQ